MERLVAVHIDPDEKKVPICVKDNYIIYIERVGLSNWMHADVHKWTPAVFKEFDKDLDIIFDLHGGPMFIMIDKENKKLQKFGKIFGFFPFTEVECYDGKTRLAFRRI